VQTFNAIYSFGACLPGGARGATSEHTQQVRKSKDKEKNIRSALYYQRPDTFFLELFLIKFCFPRYYFPEYFYDNIIQVILGALHYIGSVNEKGWNDIIAIFLLF